MSSISPGPSSLVPAPSSSGSLVLRNVTIDDTDSSLKYSQGWTRSLSSRAIGGSFQSANGVGDMMHLILPAKAVAIYYFGFQQSSGALYGACLDCNSKDTGSLEKFHAHENSPSPDPTLLFAANNLDPNVPHSFALVNFPDANFGGSGTITLDSFIVTIQDEVQISPSTSASSAMAMPTEAVYTLLSNNISTTTPFSEPVVTTSPTPSPLEPPSAPTDPDSMSMSMAMVTAMASPTPSVTLSPNDLNASSRLGALRAPAVLAGVLIASILVLATALYALLYFLRRKRRRAKAPFIQIHAHPVHSFFSSAGRPGWFGGKTATEREQLVPDPPRATYSPPPPPMVAQGARGPGQSPVMAQSAPRTVPRSFFPPGGRPDRLLPQPPVPPGNLQNQDPFVAAEMEARAQSLNSPFQSPPPATPPFTSTPPPPAARSNSVRSMPENPFAEQEMQTRNPGLLSLNTNVRRNSHASMASRYSQAETTALPTPWLTRPKTDKPWELV